MKKRIKALVALLLVFSILGLSIGCAGQDENQDRETVQGKLKPGTYEASAKGHGGDVTAKVTVTEEKISDIKIDASEETPSLAEGAAKEITSRILDTQSLDVEAVSGATISSTAMIKAITKALEKAGADIEDLRDAGNDQDGDQVNQKDLDVDVVVVGAGGAGMSAAIEVAEAGDSVVVVEKMPLVGGNTNLATGGINAAETKYQEQAGIEDSKETFYQDTMEGGHNKNDPELLHTLVDNAPDAVEWLNEMGANLTRVTLSGGATNPRIHTPADGSPVGPVIVKVLSNKLEKLGVDILLNTKATKLIEKDGTVTGIVAEDENQNEFNINAKAVILATGGFGANSKMVEKYRPDLKGFSTTNHKGATGDGIIMAKEVGADLTDIEEIQIHPTTDPETGYLFTEGLRGDGAILINNEGRRFIDELETRDVVSQNILKQPGGTAYLITNEEMRKENASLAGYIENDYAIKAEDIEDLAEKLDMNKDTLQDTMETYAENVKAGVDKEFGREHLTQSLEEGPYYALKVTPGIHHTMGGLKIDPKTHVINTEGESIKGLYAAGEVGGGVHGGNRIGGNAVADIIVFGRIAGQTASEELK